MAIALVGKPEEETGRLILRFTDGNITMEGEASAQELALASVVLSKPATDKALED